jgi:8-oxo-dGTP diphosphatase
VVGVAIAGRTDDGKWLLIRRGDTGEWALPGGTLEWGESLREGAIRETWEEAGVRVLELGELSGVYSRSDRDVRFHAVTVVLHARVSAPEQPPQNPLEILDVGLFADDGLPAELGMGMSEMLDHARRGERYWE